MLCDFAEALRQADHSVLAFSYGLADHPAPVRDRDGVLQPPSNESMLTIMRRLQPLLASKPSACDPYLSPHPRCSSQRAARSETSQRGQALPRVIFRGLHASSYSCSTLEDPLPNADALAERAEEYIFNHRGKDSYGWGAYTRQLDPHPNLTHMSLGVPATSEPRDAQLNSRLYAELVALSSHPHRSFP